MSTGADQLAATIRSLQSLPDAYQHIDQVVSLASSSAADIAEAVMRDQGTAARVLRLANSSLYAFPSRVEDISQAVTIIGTRQIRDLALAAAVLEMFGNLSVNELDPSDFWHHSCATACACRLLALRRHEPNAERHFVAGLLASVGRLALYSERPGPAATCVAANRAGTPLHLAEREQYGFDQAALGGALLERWGLPKSLVEAVRLQYGPLTTAHQPLEPALIHLSVWLASAMSFGNNGERMVPPLDTQAWDLAGCPEASLEPLVDDIEQQAADLTEILTGMAAA